VEADVLLQLDHGADRLILDLGEPLAPDHAGREFVARAQQLRRPHEAADVLGAERGWTGHLAGPILEAL
jgi:hypothetical protein